MDNLKLLLMCCVWCATMAEPGFEADVVQLLRRVRMSPARASLVPRVLSDVQQALRTRWPEAELTPFGSIIAGLGIDGSDLDFSVELRESYTDINEVKSILDQYPHLFQNTRAVSARIPIVKFLHASTGHSGDLSFGNGAAVRSTAWMKYLMNVDDRALDLTIIIRYWAKLHKPDQSLYGRIMSNFAIVSLVIFYLQQVNVLPPVTGVQENAQKMIIEDWNFGFDEIPYLSLNNASLYELLGGFFQYYDKFDFENTVVSTFTAYPIQISAFKNIDKLPELYTLYKQNLKRSIKPLNITSHVVIQDPFKHNINVAQEVTQEVLAKFKSHLKFAAKAYTAEAKDDFLRVILDNSDVLIPELPDELYTKKNLWFNSTILSSCKICSDLCKV